VPGLDLGAFLERARERRAETRQAQAARSIDDVVRGTRCVAIARVGDVALPVRAISDAEVTELEHEARDTLALDGIEASPQQRATRLERMMLARCVLDPEAFADGARRPLYRLSELGQLPEDVLLALLAALDEATLRAYPQLDEGEVKRLYADLRERADKRGDDRLRARRASAAEFFGVPFEQVTHWQAYYLAALG